ncbi:MAG: bifunctional UDP-sugar hydrolase/5'-nucleotidase [Candidatus Cloacimonas sp.]|jgi:2',3'-cyclic-nucleotide 2'-phosphodiesterase (5'-nucleotidase family)|nr:bifunctional UDP-sugar hydrolase/5'-nucleotidase [Candidatus Cloacimonas sp.]
MKRTLSIVALLLITIVLGAVPIRILHTNDSHGSYIPQKSKQGAWSGYATLEYYLNQERSASKRTLYLDAGDQQTGSVFASLPFKSAIGGAVIESFNLLKLDASTFGNHEFDQSQANTIQLNKLANYPFISTNLQTQDGKPFGGVPYKIFSLDSLKVGVFGFTLTELPEKVRHESIAGLKILPYKQALDKYLDEVDKQTDLIILLTHIGYEADSLLATSLDNRVDLIIGGHSHVFIDNPMQVNGIYIASAGSHLSALGKLDLDVVNDRIETIQYNMIPLMVPETMPKTPLSAFIQTIADSLETELGKTIANLPEAWIPDKFQETIVSRWLAEALKAEYSDPYKPDLALINCGGIRKAIPAGPLTLQDMHELLPFNNYVVLFSCYGRDLLTMDALNKQHAIDKPYDILQSSATGWIEQNCPGGHEHKKQIYEINGKTLDPDQVYRVVSHDYVLDQWDKYLGFQPFAAVETGDLFLDAMIRQVMGSESLRQ